MQRPRGRTGPGPLEERGGGPFGGCIVRRGRPGGGEGGKELGPVLQGLVGLWKDLGFYPRGGRGPGGRWLKIGRAHV